MRIPELIWIRRYEVVLITALAFIIRLIPYRLKYLIGYDPYFHLAYLQYVVKNGWVNYFPYALGPWGILINHFHPRGLWGFPYIVYLIGHPAGLSVEGAFKLTPAIVGSTTIFLTYVLLRRLYGSNEALMGSLILTLSFGNVFRSMADYYRGDNYALLFYTLTLLLIVEAFRSRDLRRKGLYYAGASISMGFSSAFWSAYYIVLALPLLVSLGIALYSPLEDRKIDALGIALASGFGAVIASALGRVFGFGMFWVYNWQGKKLMALTGIPAGPLEDAYLSLHLILVSLLVAAILIWTWLGERIPERNREKAVVLATVLTALVLLLVPLKYGGFIKVAAAGLGSFGGPTVAEMSRSGFWDLRMAYSAFLILPPLFLLRFLRPRAKDILVLWVVAPLLFMPLYWTRFLFIGSFGVAVAGSVGASELLRRLKGGDWKKLAALTLAGLFLFSGYQCVEETLKIRPIVNDHWANALTYLRGVSNENDIVLTWWDHGHWVTYFSHRAAVAQGTPSQLVARYYLGNVSMKELLELGVDYVTVSYDTMMKWGSVVETSGLKGKYVLIPLFPAGTSGAAVVFSSGPYRVLFGRVNGSWAAVVYAGSQAFIPELLWVEKGKEVVKVVPPGRRAGNSYLYVNLNFGYAVLMDGKTYSTPFARLMFTSDYPEDYRLVYSDGGMVKIFRLVHPNVALKREGGDVLVFENATGNRLRVYGYTDSGRRVFFREYNVSNLGEFEIPADVKGAVIRYTYLRGSEILDRGIFRRYGGWN